MPLGRPTEFPWYPVEERLYAHQPAQYRECRAVGSAHEFWVRLEVAVEVVELEEGYFSAHSRV